MGRIARIALEGIAYHITQRGNARQQIFFDDADHLLYLDLLTRYAAKSRLAVHAWCLMPNHVHLIAVPERPNSMSAALRLTHADFARHFNLKHRTCGHVWQARYFSCPLDRAHFWKAMAYVELNPVRAGLVDRPEEFRWSSAAPRLGRTSPKFLKHSPWGEEFTAGEWQALLRSIDEDAFGDRLAVAGLSGRPLGDAAFVKSLESQTHRSLRAGRVGRPRLAAQDYGATLDSNIGV
jgi:putative transposase